MRFVERMRRERGGSEFTERMLRVIYMGIGD